MNRTAAFGLAAALACAACVSPGASPTAAPRSASAPATPLTATPSPLSTSIQFVSERYGYAVELLPGWFVREETAGQWTPQDLSYVGAGTDAFELNYGGRGSTVADFPGVTYGLYVSAEVPGYGSLPHVAGGTTLEDWTTRLAETMYSDSSCQGDPDREPFGVDGEPAVLLFYDRTDCTHDHHLLLVSVLHGSSGFAIMWLARRGEPDVRRADFEETLGGFRFTR